MTEKSIELDNHEALGKLSKALAILRELSVHLPVAQAHTFVLVALNAGKSLNELSTISGIHQSTIGRYLLDLSELQRPGDAGYGLIRRETHPMELRRNMYTLTRKGKKLCSRLVDAIQG